MTSFIIQSGFLFLHHCCCNSFLITCSFSFGFICGSIIKTFIFLRSSSFTSFLFKCALYIDINNNGCYLAIPHSSNDLLIFHQSNPMISEFSMVTPSFNSTSFRVSFSFCLEKISPRISNWSNFHPQGWHSYQRRFNIFYWRSRQQCVSSLQYVVVNGDSFPL